MSTLKIDELIKLNKYFNAANYLSVGQIYLKDNPLLKRPLEKEDIKYKQIGHFGTVPGQNFIYTHLNRVIKKYDLNMMYISGPGHGGNSLIANTYLEGSFSEVYKNIPQNEEGMKKLFKSFSFPGGLSSHVSPQVPGSIHEGGELGYSLAHAYGAVLDNKDLICACVIGDGEAETGPLLTSFNGNKFINKEKDGVVLPILHLNGYKISNPTVLSRIEKEDLIKLFEGLGYEIFYLEGNKVFEMHEKMATIMDKVIERILEIKNSSLENIKYPMIILKTPKGWTGPKVVSGVMVENSFRSHQIPLNIEYDSLDKYKLLEMWLKSYKPEELFNEDGTLKQDIIDVIPNKNRVMGLNKLTNGNLLLNDLILPYYKNYLANYKFGHSTSEDTLKLSSYLRDVISLNNNFKIFSPDEIMSNRLKNVFEVTNRRWNLSILETDEYLSNNGDIFDSYLSEHLAEGMLEGYLLTGRHGLINSYEAFIRIVDSMVSQHAKWLKMCKKIEFRKDIASLNILLTSHVWQQDHNGYTHQEPGFINHLLTKKNDMVNIYFPVDSNTLICVMDKCLSSRNKINAVIASKRESIQFFNKEEAVKLVDNGVMIVDELSDENPDIVLCAIGDTPALETFAAAKILKEKTNIKVRVITVVDLLKLDKKVGLTDEEFNNLFTKDKSIIFNFHGYKNVIRDLMFDRNNRTIKIHGYMEEGTITTPFDMRVLNEIDRYHIILDVINILNENNYELLNYCNSLLVKHNSYIREYGKDIDEVVNFKFE